MRAQTVGRVGGSRAGDPFAFEVAYVQQFRSHCPNLQYSNSFAVNKPVTASPEFLSILVPAEETDLIPPALRKISHTICLYLSTRDLNPSANLRLSYG